MISISPFLGVHVDDNFDSARSPRLGGVLDLLSAILGVMSRLKLSLRFPAPSEDALDE